MPALDAILGQPRAVQQLERAFARGAVHHAYLFEGPDGVGKRTTARAFAAACNCIERPGVGCDRCDACRKIDADLHPDVKWLPVLPEKGQTDRVRGLLPQLAFPPHEGRRRVVVLEPADALNEPASNVLLKTLEEPPPDTHFVLVTARPASLLVTVRSRCQRLTFGELDEALVERQLVEAHGIEAETAAGAAALSRGSLGRALSLAQEEEFPRRRAQAKRLLEAARARRPGRALEAVGDLAGDRDEALAVLGLLWVTYRDALMVGERLDEGALALRPTRREPAAWLAAEVAPSSLVRAMEALAEAREAIEGNVSPQLALEALVLGLGQASAA